MVIESLESRAYIIQEQEMKYFVNKVMIGIRHKFFQEHEHQASLKFFDEFEFQIKMKKLNNL